MHKPQSAPPSSTAPPERPRADPLGNTINCPLVLDLNGIPTTGLDCPVSVFDNGGDFFCDPGGGLPDGNGVMLVGSYARRVVVRADKNETETFRMDDILFVQQ